MRKKKSKVGLINQTPKQSPATTSELAVTIGKEEIIFAVDGGDRFRMSASDLIQILDFKARREALAAEKEKAPEFNIERFVLILRLLRKGLNFPQMLPIFGMPIEDLRVGYFEAEKKFGDSIVMEQEIARQLEDGEKDYVKRLPWEDGTGRIYAGGEQIVSLPGLRVDLKQGSSLKEIAKTQHLDYADLKEFCAKNEKYLKHLK